jgi:tetratricopeptide (TPR) repeat protein
MPSETDQTLEAALQHLVAGRLDEAERLYLQILACQPRNPIALLNIGVIANRRGRHATAIDLHKRTIAIHPNFANAYYWLGNALRDYGQVKEAIASFRQAIVLNPNLADAHTNLGGILRGQQQIKEAIAEFQRAVVLAPDSSEVHHNLALALKDAGRFAEAIASCRQAITVSPEFAAAHVTLALLLLTSGELKEGWEEYEWRWKYADFRSRDFIQPRWDGRRFNGSALLLHSEQGFGDAIHFIRYLPLVAERGGKIIIECRPELQRLFQGIAGESQVLLSDQPLPNFDLQCPLMDLLLVFGTTLSNLPNQVPYLKPTAEDVVSWRSRLTPHGTCKKVGLVWAGSSTNKNDHNRSVSLMRFAPLTKARGMRFFSLQKGDAAVQARNPPAGMELVDWTGDLKDFADTAALIDNLDLVITVDTSVAHLAGALGKPVWVLLPYIPDWRWMLDRQDSPWYPTMRLFRQRRFGDWAEVIERVAEALDTLRIPGNRR